MSYSSRPRFQNQANRFNNRPQIQQQPQQQQPKPQQPRPQQTRPQQPRQQNVNSRLMLLNLSKLKPFYYYYSILLSYGNMFLNT